MVVLLAVRFLAELGMLAALAWGGWHLTDTTPFSLLLAVALPAAAATVWARWVAPRASHRLADPARLAVEVTLFAGAFLALQAGGASLPAMLVGVALWVAFLVSVPARGHEPDRRAG
jgi:hypothetical protein